MPGLASEETATFSGGCFWCMESAFEKVHGVSSVVSGYTGGHTKNPSYEEVSNTQTGHRESIQVFYNPELVSYGDLLKVFWKEVNPTDDGGQFVDRGFSYTTAIFFHSSEQEMLAKESKQELKESKRFSRPLVTPILPLSLFFKAEEYHQDYYKKNPLRYKWYWWNSGRGDYLKEYWSQEVKSPTKHGSNDPYKVQKLQLTPLQYHVTQEDGTERPYDNDYWDNKKKGIYVDIVSGEVLFSSTDKYDSKTGWPSFTKALDPSNIIEKEDNTFWTRRIELRSKGADSHLGHIFPDGPPPTGSRFCMNSAAMRFVAREDLQKEGYGKYLNLFED